MRKVVLGFSAASALIATAALAQEVDNSRVAAAATSATFTKLDADADGRVSAIEAANDSNVAAGFTQADADKDGYLTKAEFANLGKGTMNDGSSTQPRSNSRSESDSAASVPR